MSPSSPCTPQAASWRRPSRSTRSRTPARPHASALCGALAWALAIGGAASLGACKADGPPEPADNDAPTPPEAEPAAIADSAGADGPAASATPTDGATLALAAPDPAVAADEIEPPPEEPPVPAVPDTPQTVLILGDSLAATGFGALLERKLDAHPLIKCHRKGKSASGLARPDFFDWIAEGKRQVELRDPDLVVVIMGGNDGQDLTRPPRGEGKRVAWKDEAWADAYRARMDQFLAELQAPGRKILWLGLPQMGLKSFERKLTIIRDVQQNAVEALGDAAAYVDTVPLVTDEEGNLLERARVGGAKKESPLRADDKIHFTMEGSQFFADAVYPHVLQTLGLPDVEGG
jgi:uncharacterized protein